MSNTIYSILESHPDFISDSKYYSLYKNIIDNAIAQDRKKFSGVYYESHHILPSCIFPECRLESDVLVLLTAREHFICHLILTKITLNKANRKMCYAMGYFLNSSQGRNLKSKEYEMARIEFSKSMKNSFTSRSTITGECKRLSMDDPLIKSGEYISLTKGMFPAIDEEGNKYFISTDDPRFLSGKLFGATKGLFVAKDNAGNTFSINKDDQRFLSGELVGATKGLFLAKDDDGNFSMTSKNDHKYLSGELVSATKDMVVIRDKDDNLSWISKNDPKYLSGELIHFMRGIRKSEKMKERLSKSMQKYKYHTPWGIIDNAKTKSTPISFSTIKKYCIHCNDKISKYSYLYNKYFQQTYPNISDIVGKTYKEIGFYLELLEKIN